MFSFCDYLSLIDKALTASINKWLQKVNFYNFWACPSGSGYPLQVLALPSSGCGLSTAIPHAKRKTRKFIFKIKKSAESARETN